VVNQKVTIPSQKNHPRTIWGWFLKQERDHLRREIVPVDLVSEMKTILGIVSVRQLIYIAVGGVIAYNLIQIFNFPSLHIAIKLIIYTIMIIPIAALVGFFGFWFRADHDMYWDKYLLISLLYWLNHKNYIYRHGDDPPSWRMDK
jgi:hypothetical protein